MPLELLLGRYLRLFFQSWEALDWCEELLLRWWERELKQKLSIHYSLLYSGKVSICEGTVFQFENFCFLTHWWTGLDEDECLFQPGALPVCQCQYWFTYSYSIHLYTIQPSQHFIPNKIEISCKYIFTFILFYFRNILIILIV